MKKKTALYFCAALLLLSGCGKSEPAPTVSPEPAAPTEVASPSSLQTPQPDRSSPTSLTTPAPHSEAEFPGDLSIEMDGLAPWQEGYIAFLEELCAAEAEERMAGGRDVSWEYILYDIDKDDVPEFFIISGQYTGPRNARTYAYRDGATEFIGEFEYAAAVLYSFPGENAVLVARSAGADCWPLEKLTIEDGALVSKGEIGQYAQIDELVPGYMNLIWYQCALLSVPRTTTIFLGAPAASAADALTLPIYLYTKPEGEAFVTGDSTDEARAALAEVVAGERNFYAAAADGNYRHAGWVSLDEYLAFCTSEMQGMKPELISSTLWADVNADGQEELILKTHSDGRSDGAPGYLVLSWQDGCVYGYSWVTARHQPVENGAFYYFDEEGFAPLEGLRLVFSKAQCYFERAPRVEGLTIPEWQIFTGEIQ